MSIYAKSEGESKRELIPAGSHIARCYSMIHLGTITEQYKDEEKVQNKINVTFEVPGEMRVFNEDNGEQPMVIGKDYTLSMHEKSNLRKDLESWRGQSFTEAEAKNFDVTKLLGVPCMLSVIHKTSKSGNDYAYIAGISGLPKNVTCPKQINPTFEFNYDDKFSTSFVEDLPEFLRDKIKSSVEYKDRIEELMSDEADKELKKQAVAEPEEITPSDDLPF